MRLLTDVLVSEVLLVAFGTPSAQAASRLGGAVLCIGVDIPILGEGGGGASDQGTRGASITWEFER